MHIRAWQSADSRVTTDHWRVTLQWLFTKSFLIAWNVQKRCLTVVRRSRDLRPLSRDRSATFFKKMSNCLKRPKNVVWQSADGRVTSDHCRVTVQRLFSKKILIAWNVQKTLFDSRPRVAWPPTTVAWPFSDFFQIFFKSLETSKKRCLTVSRRSRDHRPLTRDPSVTFYKKFPNCLKCPKTLFDSRPTVAWPPTTVAWPFSDFCQKKSNCLKRPKNVVWQSADGRVTSDLCRVTVQRIFSKKFLIALNVQKTLFDSRPRVAWPPTTVAWPFSDFFKKMSNCLKRRKKRCLTVGRGSRDLRPLSRDQIAWNVQKTLFDSRPTVAWAPITVAWPFSDFFQKNF